MKQMKKTIMSLWFAPSGITIQTNEAKELSASGEGEIGKSLPTFSLTAYTGSLMRVNGFDLPVVVELSGIDVPSQKIPVRLDHKPNQGVGHTVRIDANIGMLTAEGVISRDTVWARDVLNSGQNGFPWQVSMGGPVFKSDYIAAGQKVTVNGRQFDGPLEVVRKMTLKEVSFVDNAADNQTNAHIQAKEADEPDDPHVASKPPVIRGLEKDESALLQSQYQQTQNYIEKMIADNRRIAAIQQIGGGKHVDLEAQAISDGWPVQRFQSEFHNRQIPSGDRIPQQQREEGIKPTILEAIALASSGCSMQHLETQYEPKTLDHVDKYRGIGIQEFCELACSGIHLPKYRRDPRGWLEAAFSSVSLPGILSNVANKVLLEGFLLMDDTWRKIVKIASVGNFQTHTRYRMNGSFKFEKVGQDGELKHGQVGEQQFTQKVETHGIMFSLTRQMIIDDDLGAFTDIPRCIGIGAAEAISDAVWGRINENAKQGDGKEFFCDAHKNLLTGAKSKLEIAGLTEAEIKFSEQERSEGRPLGIPPRILLVPTALKVAAEMLMKSLTVNESTDIDKPKPVNNPHAGKYDVVSTPYLSSKLLKGSSSAWYLMADPLRLPAMEVAFLGGQDRPTVERADADFNILGYLFRGYLDFGVKEQDWRGALKCNPS